MTASLYVAKLRPEPGYNDRARPLEIAVVDGEQRDQEIRRRVASELAVSVGRVDVSSTAVLIDGEVAYRRV